MAKINKPLRSKIAEAWVRTETKEQISRYKKIEKAMNVELAPQRDLWFAEFEQRIKSRGFNVHADIRRKIKPEEIYKKPKRKTKVVF